MLWLGLVAGASVASADVVYVGSWAPFDLGAPEWFGYAPNGPLAYTGQEAAALLFGGNPSDYVISTAGTSVAAINNKAWYDVIGVGGGEFAHDYSNKYLGLYYGPTDGFNCCGATYLHVNAASAFIRDNGVSSLNYAFRVTNASAVPEPSAYVVLSMGAGLAVLRRRRV